MISIDNQPCSRYRSVPFFEHERLSTSMSTTATQTQAKAPPEGCDACGVDTFGRPLQSATHSIATKSGRLFLCGSHVVQHSSALTAHVVKRIEVSP